MLGAVSMHAGRVLCTFVHYVVCNPGAFNLWSQLSHSLDTPDMITRAPTSPSCSPPPPTSLLPTELPPCLPCAPWPRPRATVGPLGLAVRGLAAALPPVAWVWTR